VLDVVNHAKFQLDRFRGWLEVSPLQQTQLACVLHCDVPYCIVQIRSYQSPVDSSVRLIIFAYSTLCNLINLNNKRMNTVSSRPLAMAVSIRRDKQQQRWKKCVITSLNSGISSFGQRYARPTYHSKNIRSNCRSERKQGLILYERINFRSLTYCIYICGIMLIAPTKSGSKIFRNIGGKGEWTVG